MDTDRWLVRALDTGAPLSRPIDVGFAPGSGAPYVVDFGRFEMSDRGLEAEPGTGRVLRWDGWAEPPAAAGTA